MLLYDEIGQINHPDIDLFRSRFELYCRRTEVLPDRKWREFFKKMEDSDEMQVMSDETIAFAVIDSFLTPPPRG